jgi:two-component system sensor histidine kinase HupT/HoxJ
MLLALLALLGSACARGHTEPAALQLGKDGRESYPLTPVIRRVLHTDASTTPEQALRLASERVRGSFQVGPVWLRFDVVCPPEARRDYYLSLGPPFDKGVLFAEHGGIWVQKILPAASDVLAVPLPIREGAQTFFLRLDRLTTAPPIFAIATARGHTRAEALVLVGQGAYLGIAAVVALLSAHLARRRQQAYTVYVLYVLASAAFFSLRLGVVPRMLGQVSRLSLLLPELCCLTATVALGTQFGRELLQTATHLPRWDRVLRLYVGFSAVLAIVAISTPLGYSAVQGAGLALPIVSMVTGILSRAGGVAWAGPFLIGWGCLSVGALAFARSVVLPFGIDGLLVFQIGSALEMIFLARALVLRLRYLEDEQQALAMNAARSERLATLGRLAVGVAHEVNNPNNLITFNLPLLKRYLAAAEPELRARADADEGLRLLGMSVPEFLADAERLISQTEAGAKRIAGIVADLKAYVRTGTSEAPREPVDLSALVGGVAALVRDASPQDGSEYIINCSEAGLWTAAVPGRLEQVITNLIVNAQEATVGQPARRIEVRTRRDGASVVFEVADHGPGVPDEVRARLFEPFFTTKTRGLGLGLAISEAIVREHGGSIAAEPNHPCGTRFFVRLPAIKVQS